MLHMPSASALVLSLLFASLPQGGAVAAPNAARTGVVFNGLSVNGLSLNGASMNGLSFNGLSFNGTNLNGLSFNGTSFNGIALNGLSFNGRTSLHRAVAPGLNFFQLGQRALAKKNP